MSASPENVFFTDTLGKARRTQRGLAAGGVPGDPQDAVGVEALPTVQHLPQRGSHLDGASDVVQEAVRASGEVGDVAARGGPPHVGLARHEQVDERGVVHALARAEAAGRGRAAGPAEAEEGQLVPHLGAHGRAGVALRLLGPLLEAAQGPLPVERVGVQGLVGIRAALLRIT